MCFTGAFPPRLWGCLRRFACLSAQHHSLSEQTLRMSQARRWFQHSQWGGARGYFMGPFAPRLWGCLRRFACLRAQHVFGFGAVCEDVSGEALVLALRRR